MGLNAYFAYTVCIRCTCPWQTALGAVFLSGVIFLALTAAGIRQMILRAIPHELYAAVASGIGLFIALIGFQNAGLVVRRSQHPGQPGQHPQPHRRARSARPAPDGRPLEVKKVRGAILIGVLSITALAWALGLAHWTPAAGGFSTRWPQTAFKLDIRGALNKGLLEIVFVFFFVDLFDNLGTLVAVTKRAGLIEADHSIPRLNRILFTDATATVFGSLTGTSTVTSYVESTAGVAAGGRSGVTAIVTGLLFLAAIGAAPFVGIVPAAATAPALILVGSMMLSTISEIRWHDPLVAVPAFLTLVLIPFTYSIANGLGFGIIAWAALHLATGKFRRQDWLLYILAAALSRPLHLSGNELETCYPSDFAVKETSCAGITTSRLLLRRSIPRQHPAPSHQRRSRATPSRAPLHRRPGQGLSSSTVNVLWGFFNLAVAYVLVCRVGSFSLRKTRHVLVLGAGILLMSLMLARAFGRFHGGM
jgi:AGZA family xanthine/uracil permease-like MFS transporter